MLIDSERFTEGVRFAARAHAKQTRKRAEGDPRPRIPYVSHLLAVASIVIEDGGDTAEAIAGLLHDYIEDVDLHGGEELESRFGADVRAIVEDCTGPKKEEIPDFRERKQVYLDHLRATRRAASVRVSLADKVHNARSTVNDLESDGAAVWDRFNSGVDDQLWWYGTLVSAYAEHAAAGRADPARTAELARLVTRMRELAAT